MIKKSFLTFLTACIVVTGINAQEELAYGGISESEILARHLDHFLKKIRSSESIFKTGQAISITDTLDKYRLNLTGTNEKSILTVLGLDSFLHQEYSISYGKRNGMSFQYYENEMISAQWSYFDDTFIYPVIEFYKNGIIKSMINDPKSASGRILMLKYYSSGQLKLKQVVLECEACFTSTSYYVNGALFDSLKINAGYQKYFQFYSNGDSLLSGYVYNYLWSKHGSWVEYYPNNQIKREYKYDTKIPNQKEGDWKWFNENGHVVRWDKYENGSLIRKVIDNPEISSD